MPNRARFDQLSNVLCVGLLLSSPVRAQEEPQPEFAEEIEVSEVLLDVLVTDRQGRVIVGLGADDFIVEEDGAAVDLTSVTFYSSRELLESTEPLAQQHRSIDEIPQERYFILFFQQQRRSAAEVPGLLSRQMEAGRDVSAWLADELQVRDFAAVALFESRLEIVQDFTNSVADLQEALTIAVKGQGSRRNWPSRQPEAGAGAPSLLRHLPTGRDLGKATGDTYEALQVLARAAGQVQGRKILVFFGRGVGEMNSFGVWEPDSRFFGPTVETLNDNNVALYPLSVMPMGSRHTLEDSLSALANETGGTYHRQFTSFTTPLSMISSENGGYYLLSYRTRREKGTSGFQQVKVRLRNPELTVRARRGYRFGDTSP